MLLKRLNLHSYMKEKTETRCLKHLPQKDTGKSETETQRDSETERQMETEGMTHIHREVRQRETE